MVILTVLPCFVKLHVCCSSYSSTLESPRRNGTLRKIADTSKLNRPFKSPMLKLPTPSRGESSPTTPTPSNVHTDDKNKRNISAISSPLSSRSIGKGNVTPLSNRPKRARLSAGIFDKPCASDLHQREAQLDREIAELQSESLTVEELDRQIDLLHRYNDIKDVAQIVMGRLAELENVTVKNLHEKYGAPLCD